MRKLVSKITTEKVLDEASRQDALRVIEEVYLREKEWIRDSDTEIPHDMATSDRYSWFLARLNGEPAGVIRLVYDPPLEFPPELEVTLNQNVDLEKMARDCRIVDIGRFMILPKYRKKIKVVVRLMRAAIREVVERGYTHFLTDVFEGEPNSPLNFHTKILGFEVIGKHIHGELNCSCTRIILTLDILKAYRRVRDKKNSIYTQLTRGIRGLLDDRLKRMHLL